MKSIEKRASLKPLPPQETPKHAKTSDQKSGKILVCEKSSCRKRGSAKVCQQLTDSLEQAGLSDRVTLKKTGCMGHCKSGPHLVFMPDKKRYSGVEPKAAAALIDQHFGNSEGDRQS
ncbi:MAG: (2Fe-2S) ferredoxin domain-containing protein [Leptolyngbyaceae cyanobacterium SM1_1_3]|nr:(2Fe-2S) ferredoxin domain-containing protein [Leptolyngbyaceae cyanobacterium SM1_1_3]